MSWFEQVWSRVVPDQVVAVSGASLAIVLVAALVAVAVAPLWRVLRLGVTLVHELGHAGVGMLCGRRFTGFVLRGDMSGHAVTVGPARGFGRVCTTWAGYPAPGVVGAVVVWLAVRGWSAPVLTAVLAVLVTAALRVRSALTALVVAVALLGAGALWWAGSAQLQAQVVLALGLVLVVGAWRHLAAVVAVPDRAVSDPAVLARLTRVPRVVWNTTFVVVLGWASWLTGSTVLAASGVLG